MRRPPWWLVALLVVLALAFQGTRGIWEPDEGRYTAAGLNMLRSGDWLVPSIDGEHPHLTKPPITYWAIGASAALLGHNEWAARLPGALAFIGTGLLVFGLGRRFCPAKPWLPALVWCLSLAPFVAANIVSTDVLLAFFETAAMFAFVEWWSRDGDGRRWAIAMWVAWGLAFMTKGPPGLLPLAAAIAFLAVHDRRRLRGMFPAAGLLAFAIVAFTWFAVIVYREPDRLGYFLGYEVYDRVFTSVHRRNSQWYGGFAVYVPVLLVGALPWWAMALVAAGGPRRAWRAVRERLGAGDRELQLLLYWLLLPLAVFFLARSRLQLYILPLFVPLALLLARPLARWPWLAGRRLAWTAGVTAAVLLLMKGALAYFPANRDSRAMAGEMQHAIDLHDVEELAFVDMRPFYGLTLYLDVSIEALHLEGEGREYSRFLSGEALCSELAVRERNLFVVKRQRSSAFLDGVRKCGQLAALEVGDFEADDDELVLYVVQPAAPAPESPAAG
jgi:4-amino-4-deoxy-L-arabinose transferase-like glycosyltransferase